MDRSDSDIPPILVTEGLGATGRPTRSSPRQLPSERWFRTFAFLVPLSLVVAGAPASLQARLNPFDGGLLLTLARFTSWDRLPYRDLWTLYGPGPPAFGSLVMRVFGSGTLPIRLSYVALHAALTLGVYAISRRYAPRWAAALLAVPVATFGYSSNHFHFAGSVALILWGLWFILRSGGGDRVSIRQVATGCFLIGWSFWGRYELAPIAAAGVIAVWVFLAPRLGSRGWIVLVAGLLPPALFLVYLIAVVGLDRAWLNLVEYPISYYPRPYCRGLPPVWGPAVGALSAPLRGRLWTPDELTLGANTFVAPIVGVLAFLVGFRGRAARTPRSIVSMVLGLLVVLMWLGMRGRAGAEPHPVWYALTPALAVTASGLARPVLRRAVMLTSGLLFLTTAMVFWAPDLVRPWTDWPPYHPRFGFARVEEDAVFDAGIWAEVAEVVHQHASPEAPIFVALTSNTGHHSNMAIFYWLTERPPATRFIEFDPCLTDTAPVQRMIVSDLNNVDVVVATGYFPQEAPPLGAPSKVLDRYIARHFVPAYVASMLYRDDVQVLVRRGDVRAS